MTLRYVIQRATTRQILDRDANLTRGEGITFALSAAGSATFTVPAAGELPAADGLPTYAKWSTIINILSTDTEIVWRGIVTDTTVSAGVRTITVDSMATYPHGIVYTDDAYYGAEVDPADVVRKLWAHVQSFPNSDLGIQVVGSTGLSIGSYSTADADATAAAYTDAKADYDAKYAVLQSLRQTATDARSTYSDRVADRTSASKALTAAKKTGDSGQIAAAQAAYDAAVNAANAQSAVVDQDAAAVGAQAAVVATAKANSDAAYTAKVAASKSEKDDGGAYTLLWWEAPDCGSTIDTLASDNFFDWVESHSWNADQSDVVTTIQIMYPRAGTRRTDLTFAVGTNVTVDPELDDSSDEYANDIIGIGAGEGVASLRQEVSKQDGNLRRTKVMSNKDITDATTLATRIATELAASMTTLEITELTVIDHPNARIGSWALGDDIRVDFDENTQLWHRITAWQQTSDTTAVLTIKRSSSFQYGG